MVGAGIERNAVSAMRPQAVNIVGAGLAGSLLALMLARRGFAVTVYERRPDPRLSAPERGRSINLALAERGIRALARCGVMAEVEPLLIAMRGRIVHQPGTAPTLLPYGLRDNEVIYSVSRAALNRVLIEAAPGRGATLRFMQTCTGIDLAADHLCLRDTSSGLDHAWASRRPSRPMAPARPCAAASRRRDSRWFAKTVSIMTTRSSAYLPPGESSHSSRMRCTYGRAAASC